MLAMANADGFVAASAPGISRRAFITIEATEKAIATFEAPDPHSRTLAEEGRRIRRVDGGYQILNYEKYRHKDHTAAERMRRLRAKPKNQPDTELFAVTSVTNDERDAKAEAYTEAKANTESISISESSLKNKTPKVAPSSPPVGGGDSSEKNPTMTEEEHTALTGVWIYYLNKFGRDRLRYQPTPQRRRKALMRLHEALKMRKGDLRGAISLMCEAIDNLAASEFHRANGYIDWIDHLFKSPEMFQKRLAMGQRAGPSGAAAITSKTAADKVREQLADDDARKHGKRNGQEARRSHA